MVQYQLKLRPSISQEKQYDQWLFHLASVDNWAVRKIEPNAQDKIYFTKQDFQNMLADHGPKLCPKLGIPSPTLPGVLGTVHDAWKRCFKKLAGKPRLKGMGNRLARRHWSCRCGAEHDRDVHAAVNTLIAAAGYAVEVAYA